MSVIPWAVVCFTVVTIYFLDRFENKYLKSIFDWIPAILLAYIIPALISFLFKVDYSQDVVHGYSKDYIIPFTIVAVMASLSLGQLKAVGYKPILVFLAGSVFIALFPAVFVLLFPDTDLVAKILGEDGFWRGMPPIVGSWIGGSTSQLVLKELAECPETIFLSVLVMDNILVNIWTILMFQVIKRSKTLNTVFKIKDISIPEEIRERKGEPLSVGLTILIMGGIVLLCDWMVGMFALKVVLLSIAGLVLGNFVPRWNFQFSLKVGGVLILVVMAILGLKLQFDVIGFNTHFFGFLVIWLLGHFAFMMMMAKLLNVNFAWVPIASMANVGGIATAPAVTAAYEKKWMPHAIVLAILSMATGTFWGMLTIYLLQGAFT